MRWRIEPTGSMRVPGIVFASRALLPDLAGDQSLQQVAHVATLPGILTASFAMPDVHWGYGFPIGGVAATDVDAGGVVSPGGVGFDISCGVRMLRTDLDGDAVRVRLGDLMDELDRRVPCGLGRGAVWEVTADELRAVLRRGALAAVDAGFGTASDLEHCEDHGALDPNGDRPSDRALARGAHQVGSLGSGNHFLEVQVVTDVFDPARAEAFGLAEGQICVMIHTGSRGLGHQICSDHVDLMGPAMRRHGIDVPDRQLACAPVDSPEGRAYLGAMAAAANYGRANRQVLTAATRDAFEAALGTRALAVVYDVSHNLARIEDHVVDGRSRRCCVHRKGATRALGPRHPDLPPDYAAVGQPVLVPGSMGTASYVLAGREDGDAFHSACHGAGRTMSRHAARRHGRPATLLAELEQQGVHVRTRAPRALVEEAPAAYKDVDEVVATCERAGLANRVARLRPLGVLKA